MKNHIFALPVFLLCLLLSSCGGESTDDAAKQAGAPAPAPAMSGAGKLTFTGNRANFSIVKNDNGYVVKESLSGAVTSIPNTVTLLQFDNLSVNLKMADAARNIPAADLKLLIELYVAFFNRVPEADGLSYWIEQKRLGQSITQISESFFNAAILYSDLTGYSSSMTNADFVRIIYKNVLGRSGSNAPPNADVEYWAGELSSGKASKGSLIIAMLNSAHSFAKDPTWSWVSQLLDNKFDVAYQFAITHGLNFNTPAESIKLTMAIASAITPNDVATAKGMFEVLLSDGLKSFTIGGQLSGLVNGRQIQMQLNGADDLTISSNGVFTFSKKMEKNANFLVSIKTQPAGQACVVELGSGVATYNISNITVSCISSTQSNSSELGIASAEIPGGDWDIIQGTIGYRALAINSITAMDSSAVDIKVQDGPLKRVIKGKDGNFYAEMDATKLAAGKYTYALQIIDASRGKYTNIIGNVNIINAQLTSSGTIDSTGGEIVISANETVKFSSSNLMKPVKATVLVADTSDGKIFSIEFDSEVSKSGLIISYPKYNERYNPYNLSGQSSDSLLGSAQNFMTSIRVGIQDLFGAPTEMPYLDRIPYDEPTISSKDVKPLESKGLGQLMDQGFDVALRDGWFGNARLWDGAAASVDTGFWNTITDGLKVVYTVRLKPVWELHTSVKGDIRKYDWSSAEPVLFVHGFAMGAIGGGKRTWDNFPKLVMQTRTPAGMDLIPFEFQWHTNQSFRLAADDLADAVIKIHRITGKKVHIVAHSFGGVLVRTALEGLSTSKKDISGQVADLMTLGSPYSGIFFNDTNFDGLTVPKGQDAIVMVTCNQISCFEMGFINEQVASSPLSLWKTEKVNYGLTAEYTNAGAHTLELAKYKDRLPSIPIYVGIGLSLDASSRAQAGDHLISFAGQRFYPSSTANAIKTELYENKIVGQAKVTEVLLGLPYTTRPGDLVDVDKLPTSRQNGYLHSGSLTSDNGGIFTNRGLEAAPEFECETQITCTHAGFLLFQQMIGQQLTWTGISGKQLTPLENIDLEINPAIRKTISPDQAMVLNGILSEVKASGAIHGSAINWRSVPDAKRKDYWGRLSVLSDNARVLSIKEDFAAQGHDLSVFMENRLKSANNAITAKTLVFDKDTYKDYAKVLGNMVQASLGVIKVTYPEATLAIDQGNRVVSKSADVVRLLKIYKNLSTSAPFLKILNDCPGTLSKYQEYLNKLLNDELTVENITQSISLPMTCLADVMDFGNMDKAKKYADIFTSVVSTGDGQFVTGFVAFVDVANGLFGLMPQNPLTQRAIGVLDVIGAFGDSYAIGLEIAKRPDKAFGVDREKIITLTNKLGDILLQERTLHLLQAKTFGLYTAVTIGGASINVSSATPTVFQSIMLWISNASQNVSQVTWNFGAAIADKTVAVVNGISTAISQAFDSVGQKTITATYKDAAGNTLGQNSTNLSVFAVPIPTATIKAVTADSGSKPGAITNNGSTDDTTPTISGTVSAALVVGQSVNVYDGSTKYLAAVNGTNWSFTPVSPLIGGSHSFTAEVVSFDGTPSTRSAPFVINLINVAKVTSITPTVATAGVATSFTVNGQNFPQTAVLSFTDGSCNAGTYGRNGAGTEFTVTCTPGVVAGEKLFEVKTDTLANGGTEIGPKGAYKLIVSEAGTINIPASAFVRAKSVALSTNGYGTDTLMNAPPYGSADNSAEWDITVPVSGQFELFATYASGESRPVVIAFNGVTVFANALSTNTGGFFPANRQTLSQGFVQLNAGTNVMKVAEYGVNVFPHIQGFTLVHKVSTFKNKLPDTGITSKQCFGAGSSVLVSCTSTAAIALNDRQDGMVGRDVTNPDNSDGKLGFSYTKIDANGNSLPFNATTWSCVKDNITGLTWETKTVDQSIHNIDVYMSNGGDEFADPDARDTRRFVREVNVDGLCGHSDWRLPTVVELESIRDYGATSVDHIDVALFINMSRYVKWFWTSTPYADAKKFSAWQVGFSTSTDDNYVRPAIRNTFAVARLVRTNQ